MCVRRRDEPEIVVRTDEGGGGRAFIFSPIAAAADRPATFALARACRCVRVPSAYYAFLPNGHGPCQ